MTDLIDDANALAEIHRLAALSKVPKHTRPPSTICLNCDEPLTTRVNFCDIDCRNDWEQRHRSARLAPVQDDE